MNAMWLRCACTPFPCPVACAYCVTIDDRERRVLGTGRDRSPTSSSATARRIKQRERHAHEGPSSSTWARWRHTAWNLRRLCDGAGSSTVAYALMHIVHVAVACMLRAPSARQLRTPNAGSASQRCPEGHGSCSPRLACVLYFLFYSIFFHSLSYAPSYIL